MQTKPKKVSLGYGRDAVQQLREEGARGLLVALPDEASRNK